MKGAKRLGQIPTLDGWRGIAILSVIACHGVSVFAVDPQAASGGILRRILSYGYHGVDLFFGISGFLICHTLLNSEEREDGIHLDRFYIRRVFRILPLYFAYLLALLLLCLLGQFAGEGNAMLSGILKSVVFTQNYAIPREAISWYIGHLWSLAVEEHFYLVFPWLLVLTRARPSRRAVILLAWGLGVAIWRVVEFRYRFVGRFLPDINFFTRSDVRMDGLIFGGLAGVLWNTSSKVGRFFGMSWMRESSLLILVLLVLDIAFQPFLAMLWEALLIPSLLLSTSLHPRSVLGRILSSSILEWVGGISYSLYVWNNLFIVPADVRPLPLLIRLQSPPWNFAVLVVVAVLSQRFLEVPLRELGRRLASRVQRIPAPART